MALGSLLGAREKVKGNRANLNPTKFAVLTEFIIVIFLKCFIIVARLWLISKILKKGD